MFDPQKDMGDISEKVILVTGGNAGLGEAILIALAQHKPSKMYLAARSLDKAAAAVERIKASSTVALSVNIQVLPLDLASLVSVQAAAAQVINDQETNRLDILHLNGGIAAAPYSTTEEGYEIQFGTNYMGHALLTQLLMPKLLATTRLPDADVRIVAVSSVGHKVFAPKESGILFEEIRTGMQDRGLMELYGQSMLAKTLFAYELSKRYPGITSTSVHPGTVKTNIWNGGKSMNWFLRKFLIEPAVMLTGVSAEEGAKTQLWCTVSKDVKNGSYYEPIGKGNKEGKWSRDDVLAEKLWSWTEKELKTHGGPGWTMLNT